ASRPDLHITYKEHLITGFDYPTGLKKIFDYNCTNAIRVMTTDAGSNLSRCAVSAATVVTSISQPPLITHYGYSEINANGHNYLGFNAGISSAVNDSKRDPLFEAPADYTYRTLEDNQLIKEIRTYNKYHLLINDKKISSRTGHTLSEVNNFYCRTDKYNGCAHTTFENLPATYSLPLKIVTKVWGDSDGKPNISTMTNTYDKSGRLIHYEDDYGRIIKITYCPVNGDMNCPAIPEMWMFSTLPESTTFYPAKKISSAKLVATLPVTTYNYYRRELNRDGVGYILVLDHQIYQSGGAQVITNRYYYNDVYNALTYGLLQKTVFKKIYNNSTQVPVRIRHYYYTEDHMGRSKTMYSNIELGKGKLQQLPAVTISLFTNQILQQISVNGRNITGYHYDDYGRLIQKNIAENTPFAAYIHYQYIISPVLNQMVVTSANSLRYKIIFDSSGKKLQQWNETISANGRAEAGQWLLQNKFAYDRYGHLTRIYRYIINSSGEKYKLTTIYDYDDMDAVNRIILPDGQRIFKLYNDPERCMISYRMSSSNQRSAISIVHYNQLDKPIQQITLPAFQGSLSAVKKLCYRNKWQQGTKIFKMAYDGFGRAISSTDPAGRTTTKIYNSLGEIAAIKDSTGHEIDYVYDLTGHLINAYKRYKTSAGFDSWLIYSAQYNPAGQLLWKKNASQQKTAYTYTVDGHPETIITPGGHTISFKYNLSGLPVAKYIDGKLQLKNDYSVVTSLLIKKTDYTGTTQYTYSDDGMLQQEVHSGNNGYSCYRLKRFYDLNRRLIAVTDIHGNKTLTQYDSLGRVAALYYHALKSSRQLLAELFYDSFARVAAIHYGSGMQRSIDYDGYGRRYKVKDILRNQLLLQWNYTYDVVNNIIQLKQQGKNSATGLLNYQYDAQNNLVTMTCHGSSGLPFCPRDTAFSGSGLNKTPVIIRQNYYFNPLNRMITLKEVLQNSLATTTLKKIVSYHYYNNMPLRIHSISTSWNNSSLISKNFNYDVAGNMVVDGQGNQIAYNSLNQITNVITTAGQKNYYHYNGSGKEIMEKTPFSIHYLFYYGHHLINESIYTYQNRTTHVAGYQNVARTMDGVIDQYYEKNYKGDIAGVLTRNQSNGQFTLSQFNTYSPYGMCWYQQKVTVPFYQQLLIGFNRERSDPVTHWQFLGEGHRTYNPQQHYFVSEDPAGDGYAFAANNPIMQTDPDGNMSQSMRKSIRIVNYITSFGLGAIHKQWANILGSIVLGVASAASVGFAIFSACRCQMQVVFGVMIYTLLSVMPFLVANEESKNTGLNIAAAVTGSIAMFTTLAIGITELGGSVFFGIRPLLKSAGIAESLSSGMAEETGSVPLAVLHSTEAPTNLRSSLLEINPDLMITQENGVSYLRLQTDKQVDDAVIALCHARNNMNDNIAAVLTASKLSNKPLNLSSIDDYLATMENDTEPSSLFNPFISETEKQAMSQLFKPFGEFKSSDNGILSITPPAEMNSGRFIVSHRMMGTFTIYFDENNANLIVAKYDYVKSIIERFTIGVTKLYHNVDAYILF
ncbi:MAG: hypothetical protein OXC48_02825, partial [Endozoicomonadaceae bacterium]|nr:hypothetical protein [Endozoicomonadaceae bacterium]